MDNQQIRSFIAIELPDELRLELLRLQAELKSARYSFVKWVAPEGIHLTLKFLGNIAVHKVDEITKAIDKVGEGISQFQLETTDLGVFPNLRNTKVFWLGIEGNLDTLIALQKRIDDVLEPMGFVREGRSFTPHLTLARMRESASSQNRHDFGELIAKTHLGIRYKIEVNNISLMRSQLLPGGAIYSRLAEVKLRSLE
jgi:2'-5' RNA ligase